MARNDKYKRGKRETKIQNNTILIVCGGKTEELYFKKFRSDLGKIVVKPILNNESPKRIVERAIKEKNEASYIQVWVVFDKDDFNDFDEAIQLANRNNINVAFSNQAFELWFLLHYKYIAHNMHRNKYEIEIEKFTGKSYSKTNEQMYDILRYKMDDAISNAKKGHQKHKLESIKPSDWESCTTVYTLVEQLNRWKK
ncbi:RloB family protein [Romboutsia lituseburensis]|uniref:RloB family protein n=1 Tax=Romboutsia lituseburensis TaxID=1537 RepID=UPI0022EB3D7B|nr:RloB family protein [Romboutsia lituseburensis]